MTPNATNKPVPRPTQFTTPEVRLSFPALFKPKPRAQGSSDLTYQATLLLPPSCDLKPFITAMQAAMMAKWGKLMPGARNPIRDAAEKQYGGYEKGWRFLPTHNQAPVPIVDRQRLPITDPSKVYAGCWIHACVNAWAYDNQFGKGVSFELKAVQFLRDDERLDGRSKPVNPDEAFEAIEMPPEETASGGAIDPEQFFQGMS